MNNFKDSHAGSMEELGYRKRYKPKDTQMRDKKTKTTIIPSDTGTYLNIQQIAADCMQLLDQYDRAWMPKNMHQQFDKIDKELHKLILLAEKLANVEYEE